MKQSEVNRIRAWYSAEIAKTKIGSKVMYLLLESRKGFERLHNVTEAELFRVR